MSKIHDYYDALPADDDESHLKKVCRLCAKRISLLGTSNLIKHIKVKHHEAFMEYQKHVRKSDMRKTSNQREPNRSFGGKRLPRCKIYKYYEALPAEDQEFRIRMTCILCGKRISKVVSSNLVKHIKYRHKEAFQEYLAENPLAARDVTQSVEESSEDENDNDDTLQEEHIDNQFEDDIEFIGMDSEIKHEKYSDEYVDYQEICENLKRKRDEQNSEQSPSRFKVPKPNIRPPIVIQSDGTVFVSCADGTSIKIENNSVDITTSENRKIFIEKEEVAFSSEACRVEIKKTGVRVRTKDTDSLTKFIRE